MNEPVSIIKASGDTELFSVGKWRGSLERSGASTDVIDEIYAIISKEIHEGMTTKELYKRTYDLLAKKQPPTASRYHLKQAIMELGPSGFPFEEFISRLMDLLGYKTKVGQVVPGRCVQHEVDIVAQKDGKQYVVECKFHNRSGLKSAVKVTLYVKARFLDIKEQCELDKSCPMFDGCWVVTNTKFTSWAIQYGECAGLIMLGWAHPKNNGLEKLIDREGLHPVTCCVSLNKLQKRQVLGAGIVLCRDMHDNQDKLRGLGWDEKTIQAVISESESICAGSPSHGDK